ncbi:class I SAM-dependent methyltransferase [Streptomyces sp. PT12]|uniref:class I SAM-dependent methyltransferase n=1 Tax=Streptomyces sp. PT12 TaxID=1510197 RepID=UPI00215BFA05|nr:methyltransferase domain-containing protein [Streptomyces sp. PT12]
MFLREAVRDMRTTGAIAPSGRALAKALTAPVVAAAGRPLDVLEAGAGTGAVTRVLLPRLPAGSRLDVVEANPTFADRLREMTAGAERVRVHQVFVEHLDTRHRYDVIVSGLPFANFPPHQVEAIMGRYLDLLRPGGALTYFAYRGTRRARALFASRAEALRHHSAEQVLADYRGHYTATSRTVWPNLPPARVWHLTRPTGGPAKAESTGQRARDSFLL